MRIKGEISFNGGLFQRNLVFTDTEPYQLATLNTLLSSYWKSYDTLRSQIIGLSLFNCIATPLLSK